MKVNQLINQLKMFPEQHAVAVTDDVTMFSHIEDAAVSENKKYVYLVGDPDANLKNHAGLKVYEMVDILEGLPAEAQLMFIEHRVPVAYPLVGLVQEDMLEVHLMV